MIEEAIARLRAALDEWWLSDPPGEGVSESDLRIALAKIDSQDAALNAAYAEGRRDEREEAEADARRYRWLRDKTSGGEWEHIGHQITPDAADAYIDASIAAM